VTIDGNNDNVSAANDTITVATGVTTSVIGNSDAAAQVPATTSGCRGVRTGSRPVGTQLLSVRTALARL
jgi:hypothetical protein